MAKKIKKVETPIDQRETFVSLQKNFADSDLSVEEKLKVLYDLQKADVAIDKIIQLRGELPDEVEALENEVADLKALSPAFGSLKVVREGKLWGCNTATSPYFDETPFRPDLLLASLRQIAAPGDSLACDTGLRYFKPL